MVKFLIILIITVVIFFLVYLSFDRDTKKAAICAALAAALAFAGSYIVDVVETKEPTTETAQENADSDDISTNSRNQNSPNSEENFNQPTETENPIHVEKPTPTLDSELSIDKIATVSMEVQSIESSVVENIDAQIDVYNGSLIIEDQVDTYSFTPSITGRYRFEISGLTEGTDHKVNLVIKNSGDGIVDSTIYGITNGDGLTVKDMQAGETFQVQVKQYTGLDSYTLSIGNQKKTLDVTGYTVVKDSVEFRDQRNVYLFTPSITGRYRFEISDLTKGSDHKVNLLVCNSGGGEEASTSYGIMNDGGLTIPSMQVGQTYEIQVCQYSGYYSYNLNIGYQKDSVDISDYNIVVDSIQYREQKNVYFFTPTVTGSYRFEISNLTKGSSNKVNLYVLNSRDGEEGSTSYGIMNGDGLTIKDMQAGETYQIQVQQYSGYDMYNLNVGMQKETVDISEYNSVSDSIQYTDQRNVYTFTPSSSGKYRFEIQGLTDGSNNEVNVLVFNSRGGEEGSTSYGIVSGEWLEIADLQARETYQVQVRYYSGYDSYKLITTKVVE
ncbi:MAG: hypothetical protein K2H01_06925 [Ruminococcus sp.]|nr:hypothetical protein [Ruminococcus sp.]